MKKSAQQVWSALRVKQELDYQCTELAFNEEREASFLFAESIGWLRDQNSYLSFVMLQS